MRVTGKPAAVAQAMRVLEVHERMERPVAEQLASDDGDVMAEEDKALLRNFCNVSASYSCTGKQLLLFNNHGFFSSGGLEEVRLRWQHQ